MIRNHFACPVCATTWTTDCTVQAIEPCPSCGLMLVGLMRPADLHDEHVKQALDIDLPDTVPTRLPCCVQADDDGDDFHWVH